MNPSASSLVSAAPRASHAAGVLWALAATGLFSLIYVSGRLSDTDAGAMQIIWLRYLGGALAISAAIALRGRPGRRLRTAQLHLHACRAAAGGLGGAAAIFAATHMPVASASAIGLLDGLFTVVLGLAVLGERVSPRHWAAALLGLAGALLVAASQGAFAHWHGGFALPSLAALAGALLFAGENILIKTLVRGESAWTVLFYVNVLGSLLLAWPALAAWTPVPAVWIALFLCLGPLALAGQYCNIRAFRRAPASIVGPVRQTWIVYGTAFGALFFGEPVTAAMWAGMALILLGGAWLAALRVGGR